MATVDDERIYLIEALGLPASTKMTMTDLRAAFYKQTPASMGANRYGITPQRLPKWMQARARVRNSGGDAKILMIGDSQFFGTGSTQSATFPSNGSPSTRLATLLGSAGLASTPGFATPGVDQRWTVAGNWTASLFGFGSLAVWTSGVSAGTCVFTDSRVTWDRADVYHLRGPGLGTITCTATGGSGVNGVGANGSSDAAKVTASAASASSANTVSIVPTVANCYVTGVELWRNGTSVARIGNAGVGTTGVAQHVIPSQINTWGTIPHMNAYQPDLTLIGLGVNDRGAGRTAAQFKTDMQTLVTAAKAVGDVILCTEMPSQAAPQATNEAQFNDAIRELAYSNSVGLYDYYSRCISWASYNSRGMAADALHQNNLGYWDWADGFAPALMGL